MLDILMFYYISASLELFQGQIITLEIEDFDMEPKRDFVLIRDGEDATALELATLTGQQQLNPQFIRSTGNRLYVYTRTDQADSRRGYRYVYYEHTLHYFLLVSF